MHVNAHDQERREKRGDLIITRGMPVYSSTLGVSGQCDVVEFHRNEQGISLHGEAGKWSVFPVEYKRGKPKKNECDRMQLAAQAVCLEEMLSCECRKAIFITERHGIVKP